jgi:N-acetyl-anhydromuramyl-L-alanine amidase AmpD
MIDPVRHTLSAALLSAMVALAQAADAEPAMPAIDPVELAVRAENARMSEVRASYRNFFAEAYMRYPRIPAGTLESIAYAKTRWNHVQPVPSPDHVHASDHDSGHMVPAFGVMALAAGDGPFIDQIGEASRLTGLSIAAIKRDPRSNIMAAAALLARDVDALALKAPTLSDIGPALKQALGLSQSAKSALSAHAESSFVFSVLDVADRGHDDHGIRIKSQPIAFERALSKQELITQKASFVRLDLSLGTLETEGFVIDPLSETASAKAISVAKSTDYGPALYQQSPNESARTGNPTHVTIHQMEGYYAGSIATFLQSGGVSAHYLIRDSDGQVTQMVRESRKGAHVYANNDYTIGIEQEGFRGQSGWYNAPTYREVIAITRNICARWSIPCSSVYRGSATDTENIQATSLRIKGHQHFPDQGGNRTDPGRFFSWTRFADGINGSTVFQGVMDSFESGEGRFDSAPTLSGSTLGIASTSTAERNNVRIKNGQWSEQIGLRDDTSTNANWEVRLLSGGGNPSANPKLQKAGGRIGFWVYTAAPGVSVSMGIDDSDGTERSLPKSVPADSWTFVEWKLDDQAQWDAWVGGNGTITSSQVSLDAIWLFRAQNANPVYIYLDDVQFRIQS